MKRQAGEGRTLVTATGKLRRFDAFPSDHHALHPWELATGQERLTIAPGKTGSTATTSSAARPHPSSSPRSAIKPAVRCKPPSKPTDPWNPGGASKLCSPIQAWYDRRMRAARCAPWRYWSASAARQILDTLGQGARHSRQTREAKAARARLSRR